MTSTVTVKTRNDADRPDAHGRHTATVNVWHTAALAATFYGCEQCHSLIEWDAYGAVHGIRYSGWDQSLRGGEGDFTHQTPVCLHPLEPGQQPCTGIDQWRQRGRPAKTQGKQQKET